jgi:CRISPR-associated protein Cas2
MHRKPYLVAYDSPDDRRRTALHAAITAFGIGGQLSAHECRLSVGERRELWQRLAEICSADEDRLILLALDPRLEVLRAGPARALVAEGLAYVG